MPDKIEPHNLKDALLHFGVNIEHSTSQTV